MSERYCIIRFFSDDTPNKVVITGLTRSQAQEHCSYPGSWGDGWFDGFGLEIEYPNLVAAFRGLDIKENTTP